ncbi:MAG: SET domain-containing protein [Blastocatellia bacterium]
MIHSDDYEMRISADAKARGLFARRAFRAGEAIYQMDYWSAETMPMHLTNHSCDANAGFDATGMLRALRGIAADEEITFNYLDHPTPASPWNFACLCGAANCIGWIRAAG